MPQLQLGSLDGAPGAGVGGVKTAWDTCLALVAPSQSLRAGIQLPVQCWDGSWQSNLLTELSLNLSFTQISSAPKHSPRALLSAHRSVPIWVGTGELSWDHWGWESPLGSLIPTRDPALPGPALNHVPKQHIYTSTRIPREDEDGERGQDLPKSAQGRQKVSDVQQRLKEKTPLKALMGEDSPPPS